MDEFASLNKQTLCMESLGSIDYARWARQFLRALATTRGTATFSGETARLKTPAKVGPEPWHGAAYAAYANVYCAQD